MSKVFRVGIIGAGTVSRTHMKALLAMDNINLVAISDIKPREELDIPDNVAFYNDYNLMLDNEKLDAVHVCLPHYLHFPVTRDVLKRHIPVLCEKPVTLNYNQALEMENAREEYDGFVAICLQNRFNRTFQELQRRLQSGEYGRLIGLKGVALWSRPASYYSNAPWRGRFSTAGGGCLINQAVHTLDQILLLGGDVKDVKATMSKLSDYDITVEDTAVINISFDSGAKAFIVASNTYSSNSTIEIEAITEKGVFTIKDFKLFYASQPDGLNKEVIAEDDKMPGEKSYYGAGHKELIKQFYSYLDDGSGRYFKILDAANVIKLIDLVRLSSLNGERVKWED